MPTIRHVCTFDPAIDFVLEENQIAIVHLGATKTSIAQRFLVANTNKRGGTCNCCGEFNHAPIERVEIYEVIL